MRQLSLANVSFDKHSKQTRRPRFLAEMDQVVPWRELCALIEPFYPSSAAWITRSCHQSCVYGKQAGRTMIRQKPHSVASARSTISHASDD
jgi:hypothetical protein